MIPTASYKFQASRPSLSENNTDIAQNTLWAVLYHEGPSNQISIKSPLYSNTLTSVSVHFWVVSETCKSILFLMIILLCPAPGETQALKKS